jgi:hypothetical protein
MLFGYPGKNEAAGRSMTTDGFATVGPEGKSGKGTLSRLGNSATEVAD